MQEEKQPQKPSTPSPETKPETPQTTQQEPRETIPEPGRRLFIALKAAPEEPKNPNE